MLDRRKRWLLHVHTLWTNDIDACGNIVFFIIMHNDVGSHRAHDIVVTTHGCSSFEWCSFLTIINWLMHACIVTQLACDSA